MSTRVAEIRLAGFALPGIHEPACGRLDCSKERSRPNRPSPERPTAVPPQKRVPASGSAVATRVSSPHHARRPAAALRALLRWSTSMPTDNDLFAEEQTDGHHEFR